jgi:hypothetical protein
MFALCPAPDERDSLASPHHRNAEPARGVPGKARESARQSGAPRLGLLISLKDKAFVEFRKRKLDPYLG